MALSRPIRVPRLHDLFFCNLGVREGENNFNKFIERLSSLPIRVEKEFVMGMDYQTAAKIDIYMGESASAGDNVIVGELLLEGIPAVRRGETQLRIVFDVGVSGILTVSARDKLSGRSKEIKIPIRPYFMFEMASHLAKLAPDDANQKRAEIYEAGTLLRKLLNPRIKAGDTISVSDPIVVQCCNKDTDSPDPSNDFITQSLGIALQDGSFCTFIKRNSFYPTKEKKEFSQKELPVKAGCVTIDIFEGESSTARENRLRGSMSKKLQGNENVEVTFEVDKRKFLRVDMQGKQTKYGISYTGICIDIVARSLQRQRRNSW